MIGDLLPAQGLRGYDIDGVLYPQVKVNLTEPFVIISGRPNTPERRQQTIAELRALGIKFKEEQLYMRYFGGPVDYKDSAKYKAEIINKLGVFRFFEDEEKQAKILKKLCNNCEIRLV